jgi:hypothetical protein
VVFKADSDSIEFYYEGLVPYIHFIPIKSDMSNLETALHYALENDPEMEKIAENMHKFAIDNLNPEKVACYIQDLFYRYSKLLKYELKNITEVAPIVHLAYPSFPHMRNTCLNPIYLSDDKPSDVDPAFGVFFRNVTGQMSDIMTTEWTNVW